MKLIQLRYLVAVAENDLNITQAARALHAAQPGVHTTWAGFRRGTLLRGFMYEFLQMLARHLTTRAVQAAEKSASQEEVERDFAAVKIPFLR